jgi:hypothetical protein
MGSGGEKRVTTLGSDAHSRAKTRRLQGDIKDSPPFEEKQSRPKQKIRFAGFRKDVSRKFDGSIGPLFATDHSHTVDLRILQRIVVISKSSSMNKHVQTEQRRAHVGERHQRTAVSVRGHVARFA